MCNLVTLQGEIKAIVNECTGTPTAKLIALLNAAGITKASEIASLIGLSERAIWKAKANHSSGTTVQSELQDTEPEFTTEPQDMNHSSVKGTVVQSSRPRVLDNNKLTSLEDRPVNNNPLPPSKAKGPGAAQALEAFEAYNATALECGLPQAAKLTPDRQRKIIARLKDYGLDGWKQALANIEKSSFLTGTNDRGWRASLDFLVQPASFAKVHDGGYGNGRHAAKKADAKVEYYYPAWYLEEVASMNGGRA
jgi:hypothetical protein